MTAWSSIINNAIIYIIVDIALYGSAAHEKRQSDIYRSVRTLDDLTEQLKNEGFQINRSAAYTRLMPKRSLSSEGKRHVTTVPVKLIRAQNDAHSKHIDGRFCTATLNHLEEVASMLGPGEVCFISQDDKARVPIGLTAANKQAPFLMHVEYRVTLPDHDWVVAAKHKLIPSVYAGIEIQKDGLGKPEAVTYSGPTYIAIRSGKHCSSSAYAHGLDYERLLELEEFDIITKDQSNKLVKPVLMLSVDGGPDENPRYQKVIDVAIHHFLKQNLDALFVATNAPGRSAFNRVERRMAPLSRELSGLILPHEHFGSHLDSQGRTIDEELEKSNFKYAGETLSEEWTQATLDNFPTVAEYIVPEVSELETESLLTKDQDWYKNHVRTSQYFLQIVKCHNENCCQPIRSSYFDIVADRFLPPPIPVCQTTGGLKAPDASESDLHRFPSLFFNQSLKLDNMLPRSAKAFKILPYDLYCPSIQSSLVERICKICHLYVASQVMLKKHVQLHRQRDLGPGQLAHAPPQPQRIRPVQVAAKRHIELMAFIAHREMLSAEWLDEDDVDLSDMLVPEGDINDKSATMPIVTIEEHLASPWEDDRR
uniref:C2H2-type domain-containing protein n=1 Tax=Arion vulgaris TaxID=1028688 RepID=A0A0B7BG25_9EUPU